MSSDYSVDVKSKVDLYENIGLQKSNTNHSPHSNIVDYQESHTGDVAKQILTLNANSTTSFRAGNVTREQFKPPETSTQPEPGFVSRLIQKFTSSTAPSTAPSASSISSKPSLTRLKSLSQITSGIADIAKEQFKDSSIGQVHESITAAVHVAKRGDSKQTKFAVLNALIVSTFAIMNHYLIHEDAEELGNIQEHFIDPHIGR